jgi:SRSO17 transposase
MRDALERLVTERDVWVSTAHPDHGPHQVPLLWTSDRERCRAAGVPDARAFATKTELARNLVARALASPLPIAWVTADALYGQDWHFRRMLEEAGLGYVVGPEVPAGQVAGRLPAHRPAHR